MTRLSALALVAIVAGCQVNGQDVASSAAQMGACAARESVNPSQSLPYSAAVTAGGMAFLSGKIGVSGETREMTEGRVSAETRNIMEAFSELLQEMGLGFEDVVMGNVYLADIADYSAMNEVYAEYFPSNPPARVALSVKDIPAGGTVEISFIAVCQ